MNNLINHVLPETADRLKAAGFPQPAPEVGQIWIDDEMDSYFISSDGVYMELDGEKFTNCAIGECDAFCPAATDILRELGDDFCLFTSTMKSVIYWCCNESSGVFDDKERYCTPTGITNPAEAAALAWLSIHENPAQK